MCSEIKVMRSQMLLVGLVFPAVCLMMIVMMMNCIPVP